MKQGKIYFLQRADGLIKVGYTGRLESRISALAKSHGVLKVIRVINGDKPREKQLHNSFRDFNEFGEWFRPEPSFLTAIDAVEDGTAVDVSRDVDREWVKGEQELADQARELLKRLVRARRQRSGLKDFASMKAVSKDYGLRWWTINNLHAGRASTVSAFTMKRLREALIAEMEAYRDELAADLNGEREAQALAARIQEKKARR